jgi:hypothetical protein
LAFFFLVAIGLCLFRAGIVLVIVASIAMAQYTRVNFFIVGLSAALVGAILGCLPGMAFGGILGLVRRNRLPRAADFKAEPNDVVLKAVLYPSLGAAAVWAFYLLVFSPWLGRVLNAQ